MADPFQSEQISAKYWVRQILLWQLLDAKVPFLSFDIFISIGLNGGCLLGGWREREREGGGVLESLPSCSQWKIRHVQTNSFWDNEPMAIDDRKKPVCWISGAGYSRVGGETPLPFSIHLRNHPKISTSFVGNIPIEVKNTVQTRSPIEMQGN